MANYYSIPLAEMDEVLRGYRFAPVDLTYRNRPVKEWVYERRLPQSPNHFVRVYTGVQRYGRDAGRSRKVGKDAIRVQVVYRDEKGETLVSQPKRVHRVEGWRENLQKRMNEISSTLPQVEFDTRGEPMTLRKHKGNYFWGSRDYPKYKETQPFRAEGDSQVIRFDTLEEFHNYVKNHQYSDVEYKKRRAYMLAESREEFQQFSQKQPVIVLDFDCYAMRNIWADKLGIAYNHVVPLSNVSFQNLDPRFIPHDLVNEYGAPQSATFDFNQDYQYLIERNIRSGRVHQNMNINLNGIPFTINWSWSSSPLFNLELWLWKIPLSSIENKDELNFKNVASMKPRNAVGGKPFQEMFASEGPDDAESFSAAEDIMNYLDTIWNEHSREIKEYVKNQMAGGGMNRDFDNDSMLNYTEDEWFDYKWELFRKSFEEGAWLTDGYVQAIRLLYVPVGTQIRLDELGNWKNRKADKYGVDGKEITSWIWETIKLQEFYGGGIFGDGDIDHTEGEEGIDFDRIVLNGFFKITDIDWLSTIAFNISSWNQEKELCVINGKPIIDGEIMRNDGPGKDITGFSADEWDIRKVAQYRVEIPDEIDVDWEDDWEEEPEPDWEVDWDAESYLERDKRLYFKKVPSYGGRPQSQFQQFADNPPNKVPYVTRYNSIDELYAHKQRKHWAERAAEVSVLNFDFYVKRTMTNPIATLYNRIIPLGNIASGYSDNFKERNNYLIKRYGAPLYASALWMPFSDDNKHLSPTNKPTKKGLMKAFKMGRKWDENKIVRETGTYFIGIHTPSALISGGKRTGSYDDERDVKNETALLINLKGLKVTDVRSHGDRIKIWGGIPLSSIEGHWGEEPRFVSLRGEQHWIEQFDAEEEIELDIIDIDTPEEAYNLLYGWNKKPSLARLPNKGKSFFRFTFEGAISLRTIGGPSKVLMGTNLLQSKHRRRGMQARISKAVEKQLEPDKPLDWNKGVVHQDGRDVLSAWMPIIPTENANQKELLSELSKGYSGTTSWPTARLQKNQIIFDMKDVVFGLDLDPAGVPINWVMNINLEKTGYYPQKRSSKSTGAEIEIIGGVPTKNILYQTLPEDIDTRFWAYDNIQRNYYRNRLSDTELQYQEPVSTDFEWWNFRDLLMIPKRKEVINKLPYSMEELEEIKKWALAAEEITLKEFDDTDVGRNSMFKNMDDKITFMLRKFSKINRYGDIGCPGCGSIGLFYSEPISKGRKWHCLSCLYEDKIESIKSRGDITLEKYGLLIECPLCEKPIKAYNQDSMNRHMKKCKEESS